MKKTFTQPAREPLFPCLGIGGMMLDDREGQVCVSETTCSITLTEDFLEEIKKMKPGEQLTMKMEDRIEKSDFHTVYADGRVIGYMKREALAPEPKLEEGFYDED